MYEKQPSLGDGRCPLRGRTLTLLMDYCRLGLTFAKLYLQARILIAQNYILACKLRMWSVVFVYLKIQIFFIRLSSGLPLHDCWPVENSLPPVSRF